MRAWVRRAWHGGWLDLVIGVAMVITLPLSLAFGAQDKPLWAYGLYLVTGVGVVIRGASRLGWLGPEAMAKHAPASSARERWGNVALVLAVAVVAFALGSLTRA